MPKDAKKRGVGDLYFLGKPDSISSFRNTIVGFYAIKKEITE